MKSTSRLTPIAVRHIVCWQVAGEGGVAVIDKVPGLIESVLARATAVVGAAEAIPAAGGGHWKVWHIVPLPHRLHMTEAAESEAASESKGKQSYTAWNEAIAGALMCSTATAGGYNRPV